MGIRIAVRPPGPRALTSLEVDRRVLGGWQARPYPLVVKEARGVYVEDVDGNQYLDLNSSLGVHVLGHRNVAIERALIEQTQAGVHVPLVDFGHNLPARAAQALLDRVPGFSHVIFANSGSEALEWAFRLVRNVSGRRKIVSLHGSYHGSTSTAWDASGALWRTQRPASEDIVHIGVDDLDPARFASIVKPDEVAAIVYEPVLGPTIVPFPPHAVASLETIRREYGVLLIADEVQTGGHRTGPFLASTQLGITADFVCLGKAISGGVPLAAVVVRRREHDFPRGGHGTSMGGGLLACAALLAVLAEFDRIEAQPRVTAIGARMQTRLRELIDRDPRVVDARGIGAMWGVVLAPGVDAERLATEIFERGVLVLRAPSVLRLLPPYVITNDEIDLAIGTIADAIHAA